MPNKQGSKGRSKSGPPFVQLFWFMLRSPAWRSLSAQERAVYLELATVYNGSNNGALALSVRDAAVRANIAKDTAARAFHTLVERGLAECVTPGGFSRKTPHAAEWRLTCYKCDVTGQRATRAFQSWRPHK